MDRVVLKYKCAWGTVPVQSTESSNNNENIAPELLQHTYLISFTIYKYHHGANSLHISVEPHCFPYRLSGDECFSTEFIVCRAYSFTAQLLFYQDLVSEPKQEKNSINSKAC